MQATSPIPAVIGILVGDNLAARRACRPCRAGRHRLLRAYGRNVAGLSRSGIPTSPRLFKFVVVSVAVGNLDMHAKNISLLHRPDGTMTLSPAYVLRLANTEIPHKRANAELAGDISGFASNLLAGRVIGASHWHR